MAKIKIVVVNEDCIEFSDGSRITFDHVADCCEYNYADFPQVDDLARTYTFKTPLKFESVEEGFLFGDKNRMFFVPCYSEQNGYYSDDVDIYYNGKQVLNLIAKFIDC